MAKKRKTSKRREEMESKETKHITGGYGATGGGFRSGATGVGGHVHDTGTTRKRRSDATGY